MTRPDESADPWFHDPRTLNTESGLLAYACRVCSAVVFTHPPELTLQHIAWHRESVQYRTVTIAGRTGIPNTLDPR